MTQMGQLISIGPGPGKASAPAEMGRQAAPDPQAVAAAATPGVISTRVRSELAPRDAPAGWGGHAGSSPGGEGGGHADDDDIWDSPCWLRQRRLVADGYPELRVEPCSLAVQDFPDRYKTVHDGTSQYMIFPVSVQDCTSQYRIFQICTRLYKTADPSGLRAALELLQQVLLEGKKTRLLSTDLLNPLLVSLLTDRNLKANTFDHDLNSTDKIKRKTKQQRVDLCM